MAEKVKTNQITLTAEQLVNIVGHAATQEQLDNVRRELDGKIDNVQSNLELKIDKFQSNLDLKIEKLESKVDTRINKLDSKIEALSSKMDTNLRWIVGMWLTTLGSVALVVIKLMPHV